MILPDTNIWIDHLRHPDERLDHFLRDEYISGHPVVTGEVAVGSIANRHATISLLLELPQPRLATHAETRVAIENLKLFGRGIGYADCQILTSLMIEKDRDGADETWLWTRDKRLASVAKELDILFPYNDA